MLFCWLLAYDLDAIWCYDLLPRWMHLEHALGSPS
jgi:hypothetical protein